MLDVTTEAEMRPIHEDSSLALKAGADDRVFRIDRTNINDCAALAMNRKELAAMRHK
jgi:hypothetical protein